MVPQQWLVNTSFRLSRAQASLTPVWPHQVEHAVLCTALRRKHATYPEPDAAARCARGLSVADVAAALSLRAAAAGAALEEKGWTERPDWPTFLARAPAMPRPQRLHPMRRQRLGIGFVSGRDRQLAVGCVE